MPTRFPIEEYIEAHKPKTPDIAYATKGLGNIVNKLQARGSARTQAAQHAAEKLLSAGYTPYTMDEKGNKAPIENLQEMIANETPFPQGVKWEKSASTVPFMVFDPQTGEAKKTGEVQKGAVVRQTQVSPGERAAASVGLVPAAEAGRMTLAQQSLENIEDVKRLLFPNGPGSYNSALALKSRIPLLGAMPKDEEAQQIFRKLSDSLGGKVLIQTGVAARPEEVKAEYKKFYSSVLSNPKAAYDGFTQLQDFYKSYIDTVQGKKLPENPRPYTEPTSRPSQKPATDPLGIR